jgi:amidophosphoribosyltransferase
LECDYEIGLIRNHYVGRTFISPNQDAREIKVRCKFSVLSSVVQNNIVVMVDDSIVRGTTSKLLIKMVRQAGAKEVHFRVSSPPVVSPCFYGMDFPSHEELLANQFPESAGNAFATTECMRQYLGADSLAYLSVDGLKRALARSKSSADTFCFACFTKEYPVPVTHTQAASKKEDW